MCQPGQNFTCNLRWIQPKRASAEKALHAVGMSAREVHFLRDWHILITQNCFWAITCFCR